MNLHRELPCNISAEWALLGAIFLDNNVYGRVSPFLNEEHFSNPLNGDIYALCGVLIGMGQTANPITLHKLLPEIKGEAGGIREYLVSLQSQSVGTILAYEYATVIHQTYLQRRAISAVRTFEDFLFDPPAGVDPIGETSTIEEELSRLRAMRINSNRKKNAGSKYLDNLEATKARGFNIGVPIALKEVQRVISEPSFEVGNYYGLLSSSGEGKTSLMIQLVQHALRQGCAVQIQSYDQTEEQFIRQMVAQHHRIEARRQRFADLSDHEWIDVREFAGWIDEQAFEVKDCRDESAPTLCSYAATFKRRWSNGHERPTLIVTDHVNAVTPESDTLRSDEGTKSARINGILKAGAKSLNVAWLVLNQRNTTGLRRDNPRPIAADLYGGEGSKRAYDAVFYLYRFKKFCDERKNTAAVAADWTKINKVFPSGVINGEADTAEIGAVKVRFGDVNIRETLDFNGRFTLLESMRPVYDEEFSFLDPLG